MGNFRGSVALAAIVVGSSVGACSGDDEEAVEPAGSAADAPAGSEAGPQADGSAPTGSPIRLGIIVQPAYIEFLESGAQAAAASINARGGVQGRPIEIVTCDTEGNANVAASCAQSFVADESIVATVGDNNPFGADVNPPLEQAGIAGIGTAPSGPGDYASSRVFAMNSGGLQFLGMGSFLVDEFDANLLGVAILDSPSAQALPGLVDGVITPLGAEVAGTAVVPIASADVASQAAALLDTEAQIVGLTGDLSVRYIQSSRQQGFDGPMMVSESIVNASTLDEGLSDEDLQDVYAITWFDKSSEGYDEFVADMEAYQPGVEPTDLGNNAWLSVQVFADVAAEVDEISRASVMEAMNELSGYDTGGLTPPLDYTVEGTALGGSAPRLVASALSVYADVYRDGAWAPFSDDQEPINAIK